MQMTHNGLSIHHPRIYRIQKSLPPTHQVFLFTKNTNKRGPYKRTQTVAHQCLLQLPPYTKRRSTRGRKKESLVYCGLSTAAAAVHKRLFFSTSYLMYCSAAVHETLQRLRLPWWVEFSLPQCRNWSPFIPSLTRAQVHAHTTSRHTFIGTFASIVHMFQ